MQLKARAEMSAPAEKLRVSFDRFGLLETCPARRSGATADDGPGNADRRWAAILLLLPAVSILREPRALYPYDAETLPGWGLHHYPALQVVYHLGSQLLQAYHFGGYIVGLDVYVDATLVLYALHLHDGIVGPGLQHSVIAPTVRVSGINSPTQRRTPEARRLVDIEGFAVDQHGT
jgi:hypothetical protein